MVLPVCLSACLPERRSDRLIGLLLLLCLRLCLSACVLIGRTAQAISVCVSACLPVSSSGGPLRRSLCLPVCLSASVCLPVSSSGGDRPVLPQVKRAGAESLNGRSILAGQRSAASVVERAAGGPWAGALLLYTRGIDIGEQNLHALRGSAALKNTRGRGGASRIYTRIEGGRAGVGSKSGGSVLIYLTSNYKVLLSIYPTRAAGGPP